MNQELLKQVQNWIICKSKESTITSLEDLCFQLSPICSYKKIIDEDIVYYEILKRNLIHLVDEEKIKYSPKCQLKKETLETQTIIQTLKVDIQKCIEENNFSLCICKES